jgi:hypothetical protein
VTSGLPRTRDRAAAGGGPGRGRPRHGYHRVVPLIITVTGITVMMLVAAAGHGDSARLPGGRCAQWPWPGPGRGGAGPERRRRRLRRDIVYGAGPRRARAAAA